jgi:hypothetical protein
MQLRETIAELDRLIVRIAVSRDMKRMRIEACPIHPSGNKKSTSFTNCRPSSCAFGISGRRAVPCDASVVPNTEVLIFTMQQSEFVIQELL